MSHIITSRPSEMGTFLYHKLPWELTKGDVGDNSFVFQVTVTSKTTEDVS